MLEQSLSENIESIKNEIIDESTKKYHFNYNSDKIFESWVDNNIFFPIANKLIEPLQKLSFTPNKITIVSTIFTFLSIYFIHKNERLYAVFAYFFVYLFNCIHGKILKKNNTTYNYDMALNFVFNNISNVILLVYLINKFGLINKYVLIIIFMSCIVSINNGLLLQKTIDRRIHKKDYIFTLFLYITKLINRLHKLFFKEYNNYPILKEFGPGNYSLLVSIILLFIE